MEFKIKKCYPALPRQSPGSPEKSSFLVDRLGFGHLVTFHSRKPSSHCSVRTGLCFCFVVLVSSLTFSHVAYALSSSFSAQSRHGLEKTSPTGAEEWRDCIARVWRRLQILVT
jgi:hypothetical protein